MEAALQPTAYLAGAWQADTGGFRGGVPGRVRRDRVLATGDVGCRGKERNMDFVGIDVVHALIGRSVPPQSANTA